MTLRQAEGKLAQPFLAAQTAFTGSDKESGSSIVVFAQTLGGVAVAASQSIYDNKLHHYVNDLNNAAIQADQIIAMGATGFRTALPADPLPSVVNASIKAIKVAFVPVTVFVCVALVLTAALPRNRVKARDQAVKKLSDTEQRFTAWANPQREDHTSQTTKQDA